MLTRVGGPDCFVATTGAVKHDVSVFLDLEFRIATSKVVWVVVTADMVSLAQCLTWFNHKASILIRVVHSWLDESI